MSFRTRLDVEQINGGKWKLLKPLMFYSELMKWLVVVPEGFETDFASVPRLPLIYLTVGNTAHAPAVIHDYLYRSCSTSRRMADAVFYEAMKSIRISLWRRWSMWLGVRIGGWFHWYFRCSSSPR